MAFKMDLQAVFARQCLMARKLSEAGVRFVEVCDPLGSPQHLHQGLLTRCKSVDQTNRSAPRYLQQRGMLEDTLVFIRQ